MPGGSPRGLRAALGNLGASLLGLVHTRLELVAIEFDEERHRALERVALLLVAVLFLAFALLFVSLLIVVLLWDTHRIAALAVVTLAYLVIALIALWRARWLGQIVSRPFAASLAELERDRAWLAERFGGHE